MSVPAATLVSTTSARSSDARESRTLARRRLLLGITGVGLSVVLSLVWLLLLLTGLVQLSQSWRLGGLADTHLTTALTASVLGLIVFSAHALLLGGVEYVGGAVAVRHAPRLRVWFTGWMRGAAVQAALFGGVLFGAAFASSVLGWIGLVGAMLGASVALLLLHGIIARLVAPLSIATADAELAEIAGASGIRAGALRVVHADDEAFVGGWVGLFKPQLWIPRAWTTSDHRSLLRVQLARRHAQFTSGARRRGLWRAAMWPSLGVALFAPLLPWAYTDGNFWLALPAVSTLWTFMALLLLPSLSRPVVYSADAAAALRLGVDAVIGAIRQLDAWQDDEPERTPGVEFVFHPVPSRNNRGRALHRRTRPVLGGGHQQTRLTLYASLAAGGLLGRVVHCNIGRPALWAVYPGD